MLGAEGWDDVPISSAVRASAALPMVYKPVEIRGRELVDGGIVSTTNLDIAVEAGAQVHRRRQPAGAVRQRLLKEIPTLLGTRARRVSDMGFPKIAYQTFKLLAYQRLHEMARQWEERYPGVDIVLIEPEPDDELMFQTNILNYTSRLDIARHGFESVTVKLASDYEQLREVAQRHGIEISATRVRKVIRHFEPEKEKSRAWRRILEQTTARCCASPRPTNRCSRARLEAVANWRNEGPRSGMVRQISGSSGPEYSSRIVKRVRAVVPGSERERADAAEQAERHPAGPGHAPCRGELGDLDGKGAARVRLGDHLDLLAGGDPPLDPLDAGVPGRISLRVGEDRPHRAGVGVDVGTRLVRTHSHLLVR